MKTKLMGPKKIIKNSNVYFSIAPKSPVCGDVDKGIEFYYFKLSLVYPAWLLVLEEAQKKLIVCGDTDNSPHCMWRHRLWQSKKKK